MDEPRQYSKRTVLIARAFIVVAGCLLIGLGAYVEGYPVTVIRVLGYVLQVLGALILGFGAYAHGNTCVNLFHRFLLLLRT